MKIVLRCVNSNHGLQVGAEMVAAIGNGSLFHRDKEFTTVEIGNGCDIYRVTLDDANKRLHPVEDGDVITIDDENFFVPSIRASAILDKVGISTTK